MRPKGASVSVYYTVHFILPAEPLITGRVTCSQSEIRLMLLGSPPDMVHGTVLSRASRPVIKGPAEQFIFMVHSFFHEKDDIRNIITDDVEKIKG